MPSFRLNKGPNGELTRVQKNPDVKPLNSPTPEGNTSSSKTGLGSFFDTRYSSVTGSSPEAETTAYPIVRVGSSPTEQESSVRDRVTAKQAETLSSYEAGGTPPSGQVFYGGEGVVPAQADDIRSLPEEKKQTAAERLAAIRSQASTREAASAQEREARRALYNKPIENTISLNQLEYLSDGSTSSSWISTEMSNAIDSTKFTTVETSTGDDGRITLTYVEDPEAKAKAQAEVESQYAEWVKEALTRSDIENERLALQTKGTIQIFGRYFKLGEAFPEGSPRYKQMMAEAERKAQESAGASAELGLADLRYAEHILDAEVSKKQMDARKKELKNIGDLVNKEELEAIISDLRRNRINLQGATVVDLPMVKMERSSLAKQLLELRKTVKEAKGSQTAKVELADRAIEEAEQTLQTAEKVLAERERERDAKIAKEREKLAKAETAALEARQSYDSYTRANPMESVSAVDTKAVRKETMTRLTAISSKDRKVANINSSIDTINSSYEVGSDDSDGLVTLRKRVEEARKLLDSKVAEKAGLVDNSEDLERIRTSQEQIKSLGLRSNELGQKLGEINSRVGELRDTIEDLEDMGTILLSEAYAEVTAARERQETERGEVNFSTGYKVKSWISDKWNKFMTSRKEKSE